MTVQERLHKAMTEGNLTPSDLMRWFDRPMSTVRDWLEGAQPTGGAGDVKEVMRALDVLERLIKKKLEGFPLPNRKHRRWRLRHVLDAGKRLLVDDVQNDARRG